LARYKLDLVGVQEIRWDRGGTVRAGGYNFFVWKTKRKSPIGKRIFMYTTDWYRQLREKNLLLRDRWCNIIVLNVHAPSEEECDESKDSSCDELEQVFYHFPK
jgi:hypothetical protein